MKRGWEQQQQSTSYGDPQGGDGSSWVHMPSHPYASAYSSMPNPFNDTYDTSQQYDTSYTGLTPDKKPRLSGDGMGEDSEGDEDDDDEDDEDGSARGGSSSKAKGRNGKGADKPKVKLTRGSRACISCRKIKMRCIPDENGGPCKRCRNGGHECVFEESNRGKRSTRKNEALTARAAKMDAALKGLGTALGHLDPASLNAIAGALHGAIPDEEIFKVITNHADSTAIPALTMAMDRPSYPISAETLAAAAAQFDPSALREDVSENVHLGHPPLSPRLHSLPDNVLSPLGLLAEASLQNTDNKRQLGSAGTHRPSPLSMGDSRTGMAKTGSSMSLNNWKTATSDIRGNGMDDTAGGMGRGVASQNYFRPGSATSPVTGKNASKVPDLLTIVTREEISELFDIFFEHMYAHVPMIYKEFHTPDLVLQRSQFLCTVICAIAARYYIKKPELHNRLSSYAKRLAFEVPSRGYKSVEVVQAYLLLSLWTLGPEKTFEQDRTWMMLGMAIRMATDLNLHRKSITCGLDTEEGRARDLEVINRERCWLHCFVLDRSISAQMGKPYTLREDFIIRNACEASWHQQRFSLPSDRPLSAYVVLQQIMSRAIDSIYSSTSTISGLRQDCDYMLIVRSAHEELRRWLTEWNKPDGSPGDARSDYDSRAQFYFAYHSLVLYSFGLENAIERAKMDISFFLTNVYEAATRVCTVVKEQFLPKGYLPYLPDTNFVMCSYALLSLLKLLKPELRPFHDSEEAIFQLVSEMADILENCAVDPSHQPAIYAAFIREIVRKTKEARASSPPPQMPSEIPESNGPMQQTIDPNLANQMNGMYDPQLLNDPSNWPNTDVLGGADGAQFAFIPQGGDMMILPSAAGPSESVQNSPSNAVNLNSYLNTGTPQATTNTGWAEYLPTFMSSEGFDGWDGSMLLPGFGRGQITLGGGLLHSQYGSGIITPAQHTPSGSRAGSRAGTPTLGQGQS